VAAAALAAVLQQLEASPPFPWEVRGRAGRRESTGARLSLGFAAPVQEPRGSLPRSFRLDHSSAFDYFPPLLIGLTPPAICRVGKASSHGTAEASPPGPTLEAFRVTWRLALIRRPHGCCHSHSDGAARLTSSRWATMERASLRTVSGSRPAARPRAPGGEGTRWTTGRDPGTVKRAQVQEEAIKTVRRSRSVTRLYAPGGEGMGSTAGRDPRTVARRLVEKPPHEWWRSDPMLQ
jgi:hypothetical protein